MKEDSLTPAEALGEFILDSLEGRMAWMGTNVRSIARGAALGPRVNRELVGTAAEEGWSPDGSSVPGYLVAGGNSRVGGSSAVLVKSSLIVGLVFI